VEKYDPRDAIIEEKFRKIKFSVLVGSGKGGVGKSTIASILALSLSRKFSVGLLDLDVHGPVIPEIFGLENVEPKESKKGLIPPEKYGVKVMSLGFFTEKEPIPMRGNAKTDAIKEILAITNWGPLDFLVVDLPPGTGDETLTSVKYVTNSKGAVLVTIPSKISLSVVERAIRLFRELNVSILALINNMAYYSLGGEKISILGEAHVEELARKYGIDEVVEIPIDPKVSRAIESGSLELIFQSEAYVKTGKIVEKLEKLVEKQS